MDKTIHTVGTSRSRKYLLGLFDACRLGKVTEITRSLLVAVAPTVDFSIKLALKIQAMF